MAGQLLTALKTGAAKSTSRHEARLGIMVITILVFAFGFLVYHKMDLHQQNLTKAAISPTETTPSKNPQINPGAEIVGLESTVAAHDPLVKMANLSDDSSFADADVALPDPALETRSVTPSFGTLDEPDESAVTQAQRAERITEPASSPLAATEFATLEPLDDATTVVVDQPSTLPNFTVSDPRETASPEFTPADQQPAETDSSASTLESMQTFADIEREPVIEKSQTSGEGVNITDISFEPPRDQPSFEEAERVSEPILLAMAEPQQSRGFADGFIQDDSPAAEQVASPSNFPAPSERSAESAMQNEHADSRGFNAVKNPGAKKPANPIRTAAGSGSDGKFSLAAFNYQNGVSQSAADDGSTFESIVVQNGDNYTKISKRVYGTVKYFSALAVFNQHRIPEPKNMRPGMVVLVPAKEVLEERYPEFFVDSQSKIPEPAEFLLLDDGSPAYRVGERETISEISARFLGRSSRWIEIYRLNQSVVKDPNKLKAGLILALPADAAEVNVVP